MTSENQKKCKLCSGAIPKDATVCMHCQRNQKWIVRHFQNIGVLVSIVVMLIAGLQLYFANQERISAKNSAEIATEAKKQAESVVNELELLKAEVKKDLELAAKLAKDALTSTKENYNKIEANKENLRVEKLKDSKEQLTFYKNELDQINREQSSGLFKPLNAEKELSFFKRKNLLKKKIKFLTNQIIELENPPK
ncbi:MAG: hypothetical protein GY857_20355 [Desulfobacula sp.]|nr:hypothetical protein [Desulfobacula sp.]